MTDPIAIIAFNFGGYVISLFTSMSYFMAGEKLTIDAKAILGASAAGPLLSLLFLFGGLGASGAQWLVAAPCVIAAGIFLIFQFAGGMKMPLRRTPLRAAIGFAGILWSGVAAFVSSHPCFLGACC